MLLLLRIILIVRKAFLARTVERRSSGPHRFLPVNRRHLVPPAAGRRSEERVQTGKVLPLSGGREDGAMQW
jgi:hypothetical protein